MPQENVFEALAAYLEADEEELTSLDAPNKKVIDVTDVLEQNEAPKELNYRLEDFDLVRDGKGRPIWNMSNALTLLRDHPDWMGVLAFNAFTRERVLLSVIPGQRGNGFPRILEDDDYTSAQAWFNLHGFPTATKEIVVGAVRKVCRENAFDPLLDYLNSLKWDNTARLSSWLTTYCGVEPNAYTSAVGLKWCVSAIARAYEPGCKADHMLVLEGTQGARKSSALATLAGPAWFSDSLPAMNTKDASSFLRGRWIIEVAELEAMRREIDAVKAFISRQIETYRPAYGREEVSEPRRCVFAGTTNKTDWQRDETGGRRFWPIKVGQLDLAGLERDRDQLWAEAVLLYQAGVTWWLDGEVAEAALQEASQRHPEDPWHSDIARIVEGLQEVTTKLVLEEQGVSPKDMTPQLSKRVAKELISMNWRHAGRITSGPFKGAARYIPGG